MIKMATLLLITLATCFSVAGQTAKTGRPAWPTDVAASAGQDSDSLLKNPVLQTRMKKLLGNKYDSFMESFETLNPVKQDGNLLFSSGCLLHACTHLESAVAVDLVNGTLHAAIFRRGERTGYFNEGGRATPKVIRDWANHLSSISGGTNRSRSRRSFEAPAAAGALVETSPPRRLRSVATIRGFIGGESHDRYVVRARKGQVLTLRLSWRREGDNRASLSVSESPDFNNVEPVKFGSEDNDGRRWSGRIPKSGDYYIDVVAHPSARYTLRVSAR
jgi:hypothetical protein